MKRRDFLKQTAALAAVPYFLSSSQPLRAEAPSDKVRLALIGSGGRGCGNVWGFNGITDIVAAADVDSSHLNYAQQAGFGKKGPDGKKLPLDLYKHYREILDRKDIDAVYIATPDHWHTAISIEALQAGKHVFCEKPLTLTIAENQLIREAYKKYDRVFQVGSQRRCQRDVFMIAIIMCRKGMLGEMKRIVCDIGNHYVCPPLPKAEVPAELDYDFWLGQAPLADYVASPETVDYFPGGIKRPRHCRTHSTFRGWYEYNGGKLTDWGAHFIDSAMLALNETGAGQGPTLIKYISSEHRVPFKDGYPTEFDRYNTAVKFKLECLFPSGVVIEVCSDSNDGTGVLFEGTKGRIHANLERIKGKPYEDIGGQLLSNGYAKPYPDNPELQKHILPEDFAQFYKGKKTEGHKENFVTCIKEGGEPVSDVNSTVQIMNVCHLLGIADRLGRDVVWDPKTETTGDAQSQSFLAREQRKGYELPKLS
ncbi:MAG: Gfo/Idh/MocA family oxidoreductase [Planctomycetaceae bacterium]|jgi:predicted dehydrogenase|nr:Gfo/Idh/MocA family oxidoreductase [Planctomycetaceae bacterium]